MREAVLMESKQPSPRAMGTPDWPAVRKLWPRAAVPLSKY